MYVHCPDPSMTIYDLDTSTVFFPLFLHMAPRLKDMIPSDFVSRLLASVFWDGASRAFLLRTHAIAIYFSAVFLSDVA